MNKAFRKLAFASVLLIAPAMLMAQGGPPQAGGGGNGGGGGNAAGGGQRGGGGGFGGGRGRGGFVPTGPAGPLAGRTDIYSTGTGTPALVGKATPAGEHYFIIGSVDQSQQQILLKAPTEITILLKVTPDTKFDSESGRPLKLSDFRAGDTVWVIYSGTADDATAKHVRAGGMTVADLHKYFLDYAEIK
jgi:hypothetical protein